MSRPRHFSPDAESLPPKPRRSWKQRTLLSTGCVFVAVCLVGLSTAGYLLIKYNSIERYDDLEIDEVPAGDPENYLVVGSDARDGLDSQRTDTIMIVRVDPAEEQASVLSLQRDLVVPIAGAGETGRINSAYSMGTPDQGRQRLIDTIRENFSIELHHYVEVSFEGFSRLVDAVGGVPLFFDSAVRDEESGFFQQELGCQTLNGDMALRLVRSRHLEYMTPDGWESDGYADLGRITRQQIFMEEALKRTLGEVRSNPSKITQLIDIGTDTVGLDSGLGIGDIRDLADRFQDFSTSALRTYALPVVDRGDNATLGVDERAAEPILNVFRGLDPGEMSPALVDVMVLNGTGQQGQANDVAGALQSVGFNVVGAGNVPDGAILPHSQIHFAPGEDAAGQRVLRHITGGADMVPDPNVEQGTVELWTGTDFSTIHDQPTPVDQMTTTTAAGAGGGAGGGAGASSTTTTAAETTTTTAPTTTTTRPPENPDPAGHAVGRPPSGVDCG
jgi:polyisoprenyl-teichoic acid--peptidoglycan teichoic acid transferase